MRTLILIEDWKIPGKVCLSLPERLPIGVTVFEAGLQGEKINVKDLIEDSRSTE